MASQPDPRANGGEDDGGPALDLDQVWRSERRLVAAVLLAHARPEDLEDLLQEVALKLVANVTTLKCRQGIRAWLKTIATHVALEAARRRSARRRHLPLDTNGSNPDEIAAPEDVRTDEMQDAEAAADQALRVAHTLPAGYREVLMLRCVQGMSQKHIAEALGLPETTVETRLARARRMLREEIERRRATRS